MTSTDISLAQERIEARRRLRRTAISDNTRADTASALHRLPPATRLRNVGLRTWESIRGREGTRPAFRVGQVDAELLDEELLDLFKDQVGEGLKYFGTHTRDDWSAEIALALRAILFKVSIWDHDATYGAALQNLKFTDARAQRALRAHPTRWQKGIYGLLSVGGKYVWGKWENWLINKESGVDEIHPNIKVLSRLHEVATTAHSIAAFASFLIFLVNGKYRTLLDRLLRLRLTPPTSQISREVSFEYLNRQLVWHAFTEFLLFVLPLVGISRWRRWLSRAWRKLKSTVWRTGDGMDSDAKGELTFLPERTCAICHQEQNLSANSEQGVLAVAGGVAGSADTDITSPYEAIPCRCVYCFVCLAQRLEAEEGEGWECLRCGELVKKCRPWHADVLEEVIRADSLSGKTVVFVEQDTEKHQPGIGQNTVQEVEAQPGESKSYPGITTSDIVAAHGGMASEDGEEHAK